ncbi:hypothetical protein LJB42_004070 [Komagataella kurtzmanii]|nr:hypothetical protein LJB42_004070 [Komagataella kurtzmanii]
MSVLTSKRIDTLEDIPSIIFNDVDHSNNGNKSATTSNGQHAYDEDDNVNADSDLDMKSEAFPIITMDDPPISSVQQFQELRRSLKITLNPLHGGEGMLFISQGDEEVHLAPFEEETKLYPFTVETVDDSKSYAQYVNQTYEQFKIILKDNQFKSFDGDDDLDIGLENTITENKKQRRLVLQRLFECLSKNLNDLVLNQLKSGMHDSDTYKYNELLDILNLLNALEFGDLTQTITLLIMWVNRAQVEPDEVLVENIMNEEKPYEHPLFWSYLISKLVKRGLFQVAVDVLNESKYQELQEIDGKLFLFIQDFQTLLSNYDTVGFATSSKSFLQWKQAACQLRDSYSDVDFKRLGTSAQVFELVSLISGNHSIDPSDSWYEVLLVNYLYSFPSKEFILEYMAIVSQNFNLPGQIETVWELACLDLLEMNYLRMLTRLEMLDTATSAFVSVLCEAQGLFKEYITLSDDDSFLISEYLLRNLIYSCLSNNPLLPTGIGLTITLNNENCRELVSEFLPRFECLTNDDLEWCLSICANLKLPDLSARICKIQGQNLKDKGLLLESLLLFSKSGDIPLVANTCWLIFENALLLGHSIGDKLLDSVISDQVNAEDKSDNVELSPVLRQCISPYAILCRVYNYLSSGSNVRMGISLLIKLLRFPFLPPKFQPLLLAQFLPFLTSNDSRKAFFNTQELVIIIELLNEYDSRLKHDVPDARKSSVLQADLLYQLAISGDYNKADDWRKTKRLPQTVLELLITLRKNIAIQLSYNFSQEK